MTLNEEIVNKCRGYMKRVKESKEFLDKISLFSTITYGKKIIINNNIKNKLYMLQSISKEDFELFSNSNKNLVRDVLINNYDIKYKDADFYGTKNEISKYLTRKDIPHVVISQEDRYLCYANKFEEPLKFDNLYHNDASTSIKCLLSNFTTDYFVLYYIDKNDKDKHLRTNKLLRKTIKQV